MNSLDKQAIEWNKRHWRMLREGAVWAIPACCAVMVKTSSGFELNSLMPYTAEMALAAVIGMDVPDSAKRLKAHQRLTFHLIKESFEAAGLTFTDPRNLLGDTQ